ncbi:undecaprenol kinase [Pseudarcicella hirudinis]|uniref:Undecaprenol kinase n=1 Tax=Pseudarcicella hirudinis TaxID=1079859 RepID=A0A1I5P5Q2_9BACT|nr:diacylglycerol kinase family protein [Pseudarcicella hirudinis]SFP29429.1 undecaprenol kinase [Pseudarcicella hirudinis]
MRFALSGILTMLKSENNARIHLLASVVVISLGFYLKLNTTEWLWIALAIALVWIMEAVNTAFEAVIDLLSPDFHPLAGKAKDIAAGAVLMAAIFAIVVAVVVLLPKF